MGLPGRRRRRDFPGRLDRTREGIGTQTAGGHGADPDAAPNGDSDVLQTPDHQRSDGSDQQQDSRAPATNLRIARSGILGTMRQIAPPQRGSFGIEGVSTGPAPVTPKTGCAETERKVTNPFFRSKKKSRRRFESLHLYQRKTHPLYFIKTTLYNQPNTPLILLHIKNRNLIGRNHNRLNSRAHRQGINLITHEGKH